MCTRASHTHTGASGGDGVARSVINKYQVGGTEAHDALNDHRPSASSTKAWITSEAQLTPAFYSALFPGDERILHHFFFYLCSRVREICALEKYE